MRRPSLFAVGVFLWLVLVGTSAFGQVRITTRLEKERHLVGEPIVVAMEVINVGDRNITDSVSCEGDVQLEIAGHARRRAPALAGCLSGFGSAGSCIGASHASPIAPGARRALSLLLTGYDLPAGRHQLAVSGALRLRWSGSNDPVPGIVVSGTHVVDVRDGSPEELRLALQPLVSDATGTSTTRFRARAALAEVAPPFLAPELERFAREGTVGAADALRRIGTDESKALLRGLLAHSELPVRRHALDALARLGAADNTQLFAGVIADAAADSHQRSVAALALGKIGGDAVVALLESAAAGAPAELRRDIVIALGHTRSPLAVAAIIRVSDDDTHNEMCGSLRVLTHRRWCEGTPMDHAARARQWLREWRDRAPGTVLYGLEDCDVLEAEDRREFEEANRPSRIVPVPTIRPTTESPRITSLHPPRPSPGSLLLIRGYALGARDSDGVRVRLTHGSAVHELRPGGSSWSHKNGVEAEQHLEITIPESLTAGRWELEIRYRGTPGARSTVEIFAPTHLTLVRTHPARAHPSQVVEVASTPPPLASDTMELIDSKGVSWPVSAFATSQGFMFELPARVAEGDAVVRARRAAAGGQPVSTPLVFNITSAPLPLPSSALEYMKPVAAGQFTKIWPDTSAEFELARADRVEYEFQQGGFRAVVEGAGERFARIKLPSSLKPGDTFVRSRTWIDQTVSEWSAAIKLKVLNRAAPVSVIAISSGNASVWWPDGPRFMYATPGQKFVVNGHVPMPFAELRVQLVRNRETRDLTSVELRDGFQATIPNDLPRGDWTLRVGAADRSTPTQDITLVRVQ